MPETPSRLTSITESTDASLSTDDTVVAVASMHAMAPEPERSSRPSTPPTR